MAEEAVRHFVVFEEEYGFADSVSRVEFSGLCVIGLGIGVFLFIGIILCDELLLLRGLFAISLCHDVRCDGFAYAECEEEMSGYDRRS